MASKEHGPRNTPIDGSGLVVGVISTEWNAHIIERLLGGVERVVNSAGSSARHLTVPGAFELPFAARSMIGSGTVDAVVVVGAVIRGETTHYELVADGCARGVMDVQLTTGVPIGMGVLTVENEAQALARSEPDGGHNVGEDATRAAIEMALIARDEASRLADG